MSEAKINVLETIIKGLENIVEKQQLEIQFLQDKVNGLEITLAECDEAYRELESAA